MKHLVVLFLLLVFGMVTAVACNQVQTVERVTLPPTTTPIPATQDIIASRPEPSTEPTTTITPTATITKSVSTYVVQPGDTLSTISNRFEVTVDELAEANDLINPNAIEV